ncbi:hypothetical protein ABZ912_26485 [Nonomuraea angiospora]|uniref:hypothetical protein n=1 Tax=Nonomuraea angiospora TaxID=46172 RepID=UPI0033DFE59E
MGCQKGKEGRIRWSETSRSLAAVLRRISNDVDELAGARAVADVGQPAVTGPGAPPTGRAGPVVRRLQPRLL